MSLPLSKAKQLADEGVKGSGSLLSLKMNSTRPISTLVVLNNVANIAGSIAVGQAAVIALGDAWVGLFSAILTLFIIVFAEILPKTAAQRYCVPVCLFIAKPILYIAKGLTPLLWALEKLQNLLGEEEVNTTNEAELRFLAKAGGTEGVIEPDESAMILRVFEMNDTTAKHIMTPRIKMTYLRDNLTLQEAEDQIIKSIHSRIVLVGDTLDDVRGLLFRDELLIALLEGENRDLSQYARTVRFVQEGVPSDQLLVDFQRTRQHLAVVRGPHKGLSGVVSLEDVLEVLTGEIMDETDDVENLRLEN